MMEKIKSVIIYWSDFSAQFFTGLLLYVGWQMGSSGTLIISVTYMFIPMLVTIIVQKLIYKENQRTIGVSFKLNCWFAVAWLLPFLLAFLTLGISLLIPNVQFAPDMSGIYEGLRQL